MSLPTGSKLGPYEILSLIGAGGMGEVYRAKDTRLDRTVAVKILPSHLSSNSDLRQRFEREARTISSLSHPHICALYDVGHQDGIDFLVMEFLEGETLAERLRKGALTTELVLRYGIEIADALDKAHKQGIVHRDLKPGNIMITKSGVKLLDFGLAKLQAPVTDRLLSGVSALPTEQRDLTAEGTILGTIQYMSPEQLEGKETDTRSDIFALGGALYEMSTAKKPFTGKSQASLIAAILSAEPQPISQLQSMTPPAFDHVVKRCLAKDPEDRWQTAHDVANEMKWISEGRTEVQAIQGLRRKRYSAILWVFVGLVAGCLITAGILSLLTVLKKTRTPATRFAVSVPQNQPIDIIDYSLAVSPDGTQIVYTANLEAPKPRQLFVKRSQDFIPTPIEGTQGGFAPFFSPDGRWIAFNSYGKLKKIGIEGGTPIDLCDSTDLYGGAWSEDTIYFTPHFGSGIWSVPATGGKPKLVAKEDPKLNYLSLIHPQVLPGGRWLLYTAWTGRSFDDAVIVAHDLKSGIRRTVFEGGYAAQYVPSGHLVYTHGNSLFAIQFDPVKLQTSGPSIAVINGLSAGSFNAQSNFAFSQTGLLAYVPGGKMNLDYSLVWVDRKGVSKPVVETKRPYSLPVLSPDGQKIAMIIQGQMVDIWLLDSQRDSMSRFSFGNDEDGPCWSHDGRWIAYSSRGQIFRKRADFSGPEEQLTYGAPEKFRPSFSPNDSLIAYHTYSAETRDIFILSLNDKDRKPTTFLQTQFNEREPKFSPDGHWLEYLSDESGQYEVYVQSYPSSGRQWQISNNGGINAVWSPSGKEIFYWSAGKVFAVELNIQNNELNPGKPHLLFEGPYLTFFDVDNKAERFLMVRYEKESFQAKQINVILNWFDELKERLPPSK